MKINFKFLAVLFILISLCSIVSADGVLNASFSTAQGYAFIGTGLGLGDAPLYVTLNNIQYLTNLNYISAVHSQVGFDFYTPNNVLSWSAPAALYSGSTLLSNGMFTATFISNTSTTISFYNFQFVPSAPLMNTTGMTGTKICSIITKYPTPFPVSTYFEITSASPTTTSAYFSTNMGVPLQTISGSNAASWQYTFINSINLINGIGTQTSIYVNRVFNIGGIPTSFNSNIVINDSVSTIYSQSASNDVYLSSFSPPQIVTITDTNTNTQWQGVYNYANISLTAPILNSTINTPLSLLLSSSSGILPSDIYAVQFQTNIPNYNGGSGVLYDNNLTIRHPLNFYKKSGVWYQDDGNGFNINVGPSFPNSFTTTFLTANTYIVNCFMSSTLRSGFVASNNLHFYITGSASSVYAYFTVNDQRTGSLISNANIGIFDVPAQHWTNYSLASGTLLVNEAPNYQYGYQGWANNYIPSSYTTIYFTGNQTVPINLLPSSMNIVTGNTTFSVTVEDSGSYAPIAGATVSVSNTNQSSGYAYSQSLTTTSSGVALFTVPNNQIYSVNVLATGYQSGSSIESVGTSADWQLIYLTPVSAIPTITSIITVQTTVPLGIGNSTSGSSGINGDGKCSATMPSSFLGAIYNFLACEGITTQAGENIICAIGLLMVLLYTGGRYGGGLGAVIGAASGYVLDLLIGWLPLWTLIAFIVMAALILSAKIFLSSE